MIAALGLPREETPIGWASEHLVDGIFVGFIWGTLTALAGLPARVRPDATAAMEGVSPAAVTS